MSAKTTSGRKPRDDRRQALVRISVHEANGTPYRKEAEVELIAGKTAIQLRRAKGSGLYEASVVPGTYALRVKSGALVAPTRSVSVPANGKTASAYLGKRDWPAYRYGENVVPFEPRPNLIAVCFETRKPDPQRARALIDEIVKKLKLKPAAPDSKDEAHPAMAAEGAIWLFEMPARGDRNKAEAELRKMLGTDVRIGMPIDLAPRQVKVLDRRFIVRFRDHVKPQEIAALAERAKARIVRGFIQAGNARMIEFSSGGYQDHLVVIEEWYKRDLLVYGEPDLLAEMVDDVFPADPPNDPTFGNQLNLTLQNVDNAWQFLNAIDPDLTLGSPDVHVATLDRGVQVAHPDIGGNLTDGTAQLAQCFDFNNIRTCANAAYAPETTHGMGVYGIIGARADNGNDIAGIAPNTHQIGLLRPGLLSANYADTLLWAGGFDTGNPTVGWPAEPISPGADIISCSHGSDGTALSGIMDDTLTFLTVYGRGGKGTLTVYSAGNSGNLITGFRVWAAHPRTMAIANSVQPDGMGVERRRASASDTSSFGPEIDICAQGHNAPSLNTTGGEQTFGGTSAAAPTVAAAAALMLSAEPALTWINLRDILRDTAVVIDGANVDPVGQWAGGFSQWYGFGRLDVNAAVQGADAFDPGAVSLVIRDNLADTGEFVPSAGTFWRSPDLWVRRSDPATDPVGDPAYGANPPNEAADSGVDNWIRVRVRNVGTAASGNAFVRVYLTHYAGAQFVYPNDYIPTINAGDPLPSPLVQGTYQIGEQMIASLAAGADTILNFLWPSAMVPPEEVAGANWHPCLLAEVSPHTGPDPTGNLVVDNSNLAQRNVTIDYSDDDGAAREMLGVIGNEQNDDRAIRVEVQRGKLPKRATVWLRFLDPKVERAVLKQLTKDAAGNPTSGKPTAGDDHGCCCGPQRRPGKRDAVRVETVAGGRRFCLRAGSRLTLDVPMVGGNLTAVALGVQIPKGELRGGYDVPLIQEDLQGRQTGAFSFEIVPR